MIDLPSGWGEAPLGDVTLPPEQRVPADDEEFTYIDISSIDRIRKVIASPTNMLGVNAPSRARKIVKGGDTLVSMTRPNLNAVALVPDHLDDAIASTGFDVLRPCHGIDPRWISYLARSEEFIGSLSSLVQGALYPAVRSKDVRGFLAPIAPSVEQVKISDHLDLLMVRVESCNAQFAAIPSLIKRFRQSVLDAAYSGKLIEKAGDGIDRWKKVALESVASNFSYGSAAKSEKVGLIPVLRMGNIQSGRLDWSGLVFTSDEKEIKKYELKKGDVLFNRTNSPELVGKTAVYQGERPAIYAGYLIRVRCSSLLLPEFLNYCLGSTAGRDYCWQVKSDGVSQSNINAKKLAAFCFPLPSIEEQREIVERAESLLRMADRLEVECSAARDQAQRLSSLVLAKAFRGELLAPEPDVQPASVLLDNIKAHRSRSLATPKIRVPRSTRAPRALKDTSVMTKTRQDEDVKGLPYLANLLRGLAQPVTVGVLFKSAELSVADFYKQLAWEVSQGYVKDNDTSLEAGHAAG